MKNFRHVSKFPGGVFESPINSLVLVDAQNDYYRYANKHEEKIGLLNYAKESGHTRLFFTWVGKMSSDVFELTDENVKALLNTSKDVEGN